LASLSRAANFHVYIGQIESRSVLLAWGTTGGNNTIGLSSASLGAAKIRIADRPLTSSKNWIVVDSLEPDRTYQYTVTVAGNTASGQVRTYPEHATHLRFFVIGDYGTGLAPQREIAAAMLREYSRLASQNDPPRFVLTTGDNIYADLNLGLISFRSGNSDSDWESKFFDPYRAILREIPFYPSPGNHDGNTSESRGDLPAYLDNFFFPGNRPARWYTFQYADLAQFFSLDSTTNTLSGPPEPAYLPTGEQYRWLSLNLAASRAPWKIPYFHHPPFSAGPYHTASLKELQPFCELFSKNGVTAVFNGHEHNFQFSERNSATGGVQYIVSGAGGELRSGNVGGKMAEAHISAWSPEHHFLSVEIEGDEMRIVPIGANGPIMPFDETGQRIKLPLTVRR
jgi:hypothetical protein